MSNARNFFSYRMRGLNAGLDQGRTTALSLSIQAGTNLRALPVELPLAGPGDVAGVPKSMIHRRWPEPGSATTPSGTMAYIEFARDDLPWFLTPAGDHPNRPLPWLSLLVVPEEHADVDFSPSGDPVPHITLSGEVAAQLPNPAEAWAFAHGETRPDGTSVSRVIAARHLDAGRAWRAVLVPTFADSLSPGGTDSNGSGPFAWGGTEATLPVYDTWTFRTSTIPVFEDLVKDLRPGPRSETVPVFSWSRATMAQVDPQNRLGGKSFLRTALTASAQFFDRVSDGPVIGPAPRHVDAVAGRMGPILENNGAITPPIYGSNYASADANWLRDINYDPSLRVAAGFGQQIVRDRQDALVRDVWEFAGQIRTANTMIGAAAVARSASEKLYAGLKNLSDIELVSLVVPALHRTKNAQTGRSIARDVDGTTLSIASSAFARAALRRSMRRRVGANPQADQPDLIPFSNAFGRGRIPQGKPTLPPTMMIQDSGRFVSNPRSARQAVRSRFDTVPRDRPQGSEITELSNLARMARSGSGDRNLAPADANALRDALEPNRAIGQRITHRIDGLDTRIPFAQLRLEPELPLPLVEALGAISPALVSPALQALPKNSLTLLEIDAGFCEALIAGANHELMRELMWRGYPGRLDMTPLRRLFPKPKVPQVTGRLTTPMINWSGKIGTHLDEGVEAVLVLRSDILQLFPDTAMFVFPAIWTADGTRHLAPSDRHRPVFPLVQGHLPPDAMYLGYDIGSADLRGLDVMPDTATGTTRGAGYYLVFHGPAARDSFGFDSPDLFVDGTDIVDLPSWDDVNWRHVGWSDGSNGGPPNVNMTVAGLTGDRPQNVQNHQGPGAHPDAELSLDGDSAALAAIMVARPLTAAIHLSDIIDAEVAK